MWGNDTKCVFVCTQAIHLCGFLEEQSVQLKGKRIIELGAGTGVVGIVAARLGMLLGFVYLFKTVVISVSMI